jgi:hypothetical protein
MKRNSALSVLSLALALIMCLSLVPMTALAAPDPTVQTLAPTDVTSTATPAKAAISRKSATMEINSTLKLSVKNLGDATTMVEQQRKDCGRQRDLRQGVRKESRHSHGHGHSNSKQENHGDPDLQSHSGGCQSKSDNRLSCHRPQQQAGGSARIA